MSINVFPRKNPNVPWKETTVMNAPIIMEMNNGSAVKDIIIIIK